MEEDVPVPLISHVKNFVHSFFSNVVVYMNNQQVYKSNGLYAHKCYISNRLIGAISENQGISNYLGFGYEVFLEEVTDVPLSEHTFSQREQKCSVNPIASCYIVYWG